MITNKSHVDAIRKQEPYLSEKNIIVEPEKKNTAMAMGVATAYIYKKNPNAVIINLATDQLIKNLDVYLKTLIAAAKFSHKHQLMSTVGIAPSFPHTGYEYIKLDKPFDKIDGETIYKIDSFIKRPEVSDPKDPIKKAKKYLKSKKFTWNANIYVWPAKTVLDEFKTLAPDIYKNIMSIYKAIGTKAEKAVFKKQYHQARSDQIDFVIGTQSKKLYVLRGEFGWTDIGSWKVVYDLSKKDKNGNSVIVHGEKGRHIGINTTNTLIQTEDQLIATIGVDNLAIIDTKDALLICKLDQTQDVRDIVEILKEKKLNQYL